jgi:hypothetical protein
VGYRYLIKQPARFMRELLRLLLQPLLLRLPVAKNVLVGLGHDESSHRSRAAELTVFFNIPFIVSVLVCCLEHAARLLTPLSLSRG